MNDQLTEILIVEDSPTQALQLKRLLQKHGYEVKVAENGEEGLEMIHQQKPHIVISDIHMPKMNGFELSYAIHQNPETDDIPVILVTSFSDSMDVIRAMQSGADFFLPRPFDEDLLVTRIQNVLKNKNLHTLREDGEMIEVFFDGGRHPIKADPFQMINLLLSTFETVILQNEAQRRLSHEYETVFNSTQDAMFLVKPFEDGSFQYIQNNHTHQNMTGLAPDDFRGKTPQDLYGESDGGRMVYYYQQCVDSRNTVSFEESINDHAGRRYWHTMLSPVIEEGLVTYIVGSSREITDQKRMEKQLQECEAMNRLLKENKA